MRRAKIVATLGPSSNTVEKIAELISAGLNVARINMSHGTYEGHSQVIANVREASRQLKMEVAILLDLQGPKIRVDKLPSPLQLKAGEEWVIGATPLMNEYPEYRNCFIPTVYENLVEDARVGCSILFDDGLIEAKAIGKKQDVLIIKIIIGGELKSNKGINLPDIAVSAPSFTQKDQEDLMFGLTQGIDFVALSFVRCAEDILEVKKLLHKLKVTTPIISKIEKPEAIKNIHEIIKVTDGIMIARGDMGVELGNHLVPPVQKRIINLCNEAGKPVITATQMLESMIQNARPTRAEASDVANAIWDGTDAVMCSAETASGKYPVETIKTMEAIILEAERMPKERPLIRNIDLRSVTASIQVAASLVAEKISAKWILSLTQSGKSCLYLSRFRPKTQVLGVTPSLGIARRMCLYWGISPYLLDESLIYRPLSHLQNQSQNQSQNQNQNIKQNPSHGHGQNFNHNQSHEEINYQQNLVADNLERLMLEKMKAEGFVQNADRVVITHGDGKIFKQNTSHSVRVEIIHHTPAGYMTALPGKDSHIEQADFENGKILLDTQICASCQTCVSICPHEIWAVTPDRGRLTYIDQKNAPDCSLDMACVENCPTGAIEIIPQS